jgi:hypothetical protein
MRRLFDTVPFFKTITTPKDLGWVDKKLQAGARGSSASFRALTNFGVAGTQADRLFRFVDLVQHTSSEGNSSATLVAPA